MTGYRFDFKRLANPPADPYLTVGRMLRAHIDRDPTGERRRRLHAALQDLADALQPFAKVSSDAPPLPAAVRTPKRRRTLDSASLLVDGLQADRCA